MAKLSKKRGRTGVPSLRRVGNFLYKESVEGISVCVYTYGTTRKTKETPARSSGVDYTLSVEPIPLEIAMEPTPENVRPYFLLDEKIDKEKRLEELKDLEPSEKTKAINELEKELDFLKKRRENFPFFTRKEELERLALFAEYVARDRELRSKIQLIEEGYNKERLMKTLETVGEDEIQEIFERLGYSIVKK